jgi:hypothetical protein
MNKAQVTWESVLGKVIDFIKLEAQKLEAARNENVKTLFQEFGDMDSIIEYLHSDNLPPEGTHVILHFYSNKSLHIVFFVTADIL